VGTSTSAGESELRCGVGWVGREMEFSNIAKERMGLYVGMRLSGTLNSPLRELAFPSPFTPNNRRAYYCDWRGGFPSGSRN